MSDTERIRIEAEIGEPDVVVVADPEALAAAAAARVADALVAAVAERGRADLATTGGSTPAGLYRRLTSEPLRDRVPWHAVHIWWGDDRYVPRDHPLSNVFGLDEILLDEGHGVPIPIDHVHPWPTGQAIAEERGPAWCAATYAAEALSEVPQGSAGVPAFDLVLLGIGPDGHLLSVFPGSPAIGSAELAMAIPAPTHIEPHLPRVTFNPTILGAAPAILVMVSGAAKADVLGRILDGPRLDPATPAGLPAQLARRASATWLVDAPAAGRLRPR
ncbi:MAG TPA: 6-phosphogluconolactonase [Candidatus Limnocylindrales bacterium]|nr:6-phosphogluconolactonase [Candidatus Limnocylindrales bacterium]